MLNRTIGIAALVLMLSANAALFRRDFRHRWQAGDPPPSDRTMLAEGEQRLVQVGIFDGRGRNIGRSWTRAECKEKSRIVQVHTSTVLEPLLLPGDMRSPRVLITMDVTFHQTFDRIDELKFSIRGLGIPVSFEGYATPDGQFPFEWQVGEDKGQVLLDSVAPALMGDMIRPFDRLPHLAVGRRWEIDVLDPVSILFNHGQTRGLSPSSMLVEVTGRTVIDHGGEAVEVFVVESDHAVAYADADGRVLKQVIRSLPFLGRLELIDEPYDHELRRQTTTAVRLGAGGNGNL